MDPEDFRNKTTRGSRGGAGPSGFPEMYTGPGRGHRTSGVLPKLPRLIKGVTDAEGRCRFCGHKSACKCDCPPCHIEIKEAA